MRKSNKKRINNKINSNLISLQRASEFSQFHEVFEKYSKRKKLKPQEKGAITRKYNKLLNVAYEAGGINYLTPVTKKVAKKLENQKRKDVLLGGFNVVKLNKYNNGTELELNDDGDFIEKRKVEKADRFDLQQGRLITFVSVDCNFDFSTGKYEKYDDDEIQDKVKTLVIKRFISSYNKRKKKLPKTCEFYLWGNQGIMYKNAASDFPALIIWLENWIELYLDRVIEYNGALSDELLGWCWHTNVRIKRKQKAKGVNNGKKTNRGS